MCQSAGESSLNHLQTSSYQRVLMATGNKCSTSLHRWKGVRDPCIPVPASTVDVWPLNQTLVDSSSTGTHMNGWHASCQWFFNLSMGIFRSRFFQNKWEFIFILLDFLQNMNSAFKYSWNILVYYTWIYGCSSSAQCTGLYWGHAPYVHRWFLEPRTTEAPFEPRAPELLRPVWQEVVQVLMVFDVCGLVCGQWLFSFSFEKNWILP